MKRTWQKTGRPFSAEPSVPAAKLLRCLGILRALQNRRMALWEISKQFDISERTVYRYVALFEECGFIIDTDFNHKFFIVSPKTMQSPGYSGAFRTPEL